MSDKTPEVISLSVKLRQQQKMTSDGRVVIRCVICSQPIVDAIYRGASTAVCYYCHTQTPRPPEQILEEPTGIYTEEEKKKDKAGGFFQSLIKAIGFKQQSLEDELPEEKQKNLDSVKESKRKKRKPLFPSNDFREGE